MRYRKNDVAAIKYTKTQVMDSAGYSSTPTWTAGATVYIDVQPISASKSFFAEYGPESESPDSRIAYTDIDDLATGDYVKIGVVSYEVRGKAPGYSHDECVLVPFKGTI
jgi:hypothetical protein